MFYSNVLITGCNRGIGLALIAALEKEPGVGKIYGLKEIAEKSAKIVIIDNVDLSEESSFETLKNKLQNSTIDLIINNAGCFFRPTNTNSIFSDDAESFIKTYKINCVAPYNTVKYLFDYLTKDCDKLHKAVVNISSSYGSIALNVDGGRFSYKSSKAALNQINKSLSIDLKKFNISCVSLHPGWVRTDMGGENADIDTATSVAGMMQVMHRMFKDEKLEMSGKLYSYTGRELPF